VKYEARVGTKKQHTQRCLLNVTWCWMDWIGSGWSL